MKFSLEWINDYCTIDLSMDELIARLTLAGLEVEGTERVGDDTCVELEITANRPDALSLIGIARDIAAVTDKTLRLPETAFKEAKEKATSLASVEVAAPDLCPHYTARVVTGVAVGESPDWLKKRLVTIGIRPVNNVVDITNYVLMETGQPLHAFDLDKLAGGRVVVRKATKGETIALIDGKKVEISPDMLLIADAQRPVAIAGVMGGAQTEVGSGTTRLLIESAGFDRLTVRRAARVLKLSTDSSYRFERGVDPAGVEVGSRRAARLIAELCGGAVARGAITVGEPSRSEPVLTLRAERIQRILGIDLGADKAAELLERIGFSCSGKGDARTVSVPTWRADVTREIDLIEEVARLYGYDAIPPSDGIEARMTTPTAEDRIADRTRNLFVAGGYHETLTVSFVEPEGKGRLSPWTDAEPLRISNPVNKEMDALRLSMLPAMLRARKVNQDAGERDVRLFEIGSAYLPTKPGEQPEEPAILAAVTDDRFGTLKGMVEALLRRLRIGPVRYQKGSWEALNAGESAQIRVGNETVGHIGQVARSTAKAFGLKKSPTYMEMNFSRVIALADLTARFEPLPVFPAMVRELSLVVDEAVRWDQIREAIEAAEPAFMTDLAYRDCFRGEPIGAGRKAILVRLTFRAEDRTLTGEQTDQTVAALVALLEKQLGATLRTG